MKQWELFELTLPLAGGDVECEKVTVTFTVGDTVTTVRGFCDGDGICKVRYDRWGFSTMTHEEDLCYLSTVLRRLAAFPNVWWSLANEYDLLPAKSMEDWYGLESYIAANDPFHNLYSVHYCFKPWDYSRPAVTHVSAQTKTVSRVAEWRARYKKPVVIDECCYEGNFPEPWGNLSGREMTYRFWCVAATGGFCTHGETFLDDEKEIVWWAKGGELKGESPARIGFLREIIESLPGTLEPIPDRKAGMLAPAGREMIRSKLAFVPAARRHTVEMILDTDPVDLRAVIENEMLYEGHCGTDAYLTFFLRQCRARTALELPEDGIYRVEVIDTWEMTRTVAAAHASGKTTINLPGKEGIAILAVRTGNKQK